VTSCKPKSSGDAVSGDAAEKAYVAPVRGINKVTRKYLYLLVTKQTK
jgi:hypothetical protein